MVVLSFPFLNNRSVIPRACLLSSGLLSMQNFIGLFIFWDYHGNGVPQILAIEMLVNKDSSLSNGWACLRFRLVDCAILSRLNLYHNLIHLKLCASELHFIYAASMFGYICLIHALEIYGFLFGMLNPVMFCAEYGADN